MSRILAVIEKMRSLGMGAESILAVVETMETRSHADDRESAIEARRESDRERKARQRAREAAGIVTGQVTGHVTKSHVTDDNLFPPRDNNQPPSNLTSFGDSSGARKAFEKFWEAYPNRMGANPKKPARDKFLAAVKRGDDPEAIIAGAKAYAASVAHADPKFTAQAVTWLNQCRWQDDHTPVARPSTGPPQPRRQPEISSQLRALGNLMNGKQTSAFDGPTVIDASPNAGHARSFSA